MPRDALVKASETKLKLWGLDDDQTCAKQVVIKMADASKIEKDLPLNTPVEIAATFPTAGKLGYARGMDMVKGTITVQ